MATTTTKAIRERIIELVRAIVPEILAEDRFRLFRGEGDADFVEAAASQGAGALRLFQVRDTGNWEAPEVSTMNLSGRRVTFEVLVAYPHTNRAGAANALDRDDAIRADERALERLVGLTGYNNFAGAHPNATPLETASSRVPGEGVDVLYFQQTFFFYEAT